MNGRLGKLLRARRGNESRLSFVKKLRLSYTFVRSIEEGLRLPSDQIVAQIAECLDLDPEELLIAAYCDRSEPLAKALAHRGVKDCLGAETEDALPGERPAPLSFRPNSARVERGETNGLTN